MPFLLVTTDGDLTNWTCGLQKRFNYDISATIGFDGPRTRGVLNKHKIGTIYQIGFPIRDDFFEKKNLSAIRTEWNLPPETFTIMISMGSAGGSSTYDYVKRIVRINQNVHILACVGRNDQLKKKIERLAQNTSRKAPSISIIPFTTRLSDLMAVSDLLITKPVPGTINEAIAMKLPMLIDNTSAQLFWERANITFVENNGFGDTVKKMNHLKGLLARYRHDDFYYDAIKQNLMAYNFPHFDKNIKTIIHCLCPPY